MTMKLVNYSPWKELTPWTGFEPLREFRALEERLERMFGDLLPRVREEGLARGWEPAVDVYETDKEFVLKAELPEIEEKDVHVSIDGNMLTLSGERREEKEIQKDRFHRTERFYGSFARSFTLPETVDRENIKATFKGGVMRLTLPKREGAKPKEIKIETGK